MANGMIIEGKENFNGIFALETRNLLLNMSATMLLTANVYSLSLSDRSSALLAPLVNSSATRIMRNNVFDAALC